MILRCTYILPFFPVSLRPLAFRLVYFYLWILLWLKISPVYGYLIADAFHPALHAETAFCRLVTGTDFIIV